MKHIISLVSAVLLLAGVTFALAVSAGVGHNATLVTQPQANSITSDTLDLEVKLWYLPFGTMDDDPFLWKEYKKSVKISTTDK